MKKKLMTAKSRAQGNGKGSKHCSLRGITIASADGLLGECVQFACGGVDDAEFLLRYGEGYLDATAFCSTFYVPIVVTVWIEV